MKLCMGCMNEIDDHLATCPICGFNESTLRQESYYLDPGTIVGGRYIVGRVMNYNGHTISYLGMDAQDNKKVVVKEYLPSDFSTRSQGEKEVTIYSGDAQEQFENGLSNFLNESSRIQSLGRPEGVARIYDCVAENDTGYVISEYVEGATLKELLDSGKKYTVQEAKAIIVQILSGLSKLHPMDVIHCDISPENIVICEDGSVKLLNFGATRYVTTANSKSLAIILKQGYAPEEQYRSKGKRGPWTDVYAVAAVMYRMITGVVPPESVERTLVDELKAPSKRGVNIPVNIENALMNALNVYQEERTPSAGIFLKELNSESVKRIKVKKTKVETGRFPAWAKIMVASLLCVVLAGGGILYFLMSKEDKGSVASADILVKDYKGMTIEEAKEAIDALNKTLKENNVDCQLVLKEEALYDNDTNKVNTVVRQTISSGTNLASGYTGAQEIILSYCQNETISYGQLSQYNAYQLAKKMGKDDVTSTPFVSSDEYSSDDLFAISEIRLKDNSVILREDIEDPKYVEKTISIDQIMKISYSSRYCILENVTKETYLGQNISQVKINTYKSTNDQDSDPIQAEKLLSKVKALFDDSYYSFIYGEGIICGVEMSQVDKNGIVDTRNGNGIYESKLFKVVGKGKSFVINRFSTGAALRDTLMAAGISGENITITGGGEGDELIDVTVEKGTKECFAGDAIITIQTKKKVVVVPSTQSSRGTGGETGGTGGEAGGTGGEAGGTGGEAGGTGGFE